MLINWKGKDTKKLYISCILLFSSPSSFFVVETLAALFLKFFYRFDQENDDNSIKHGMLALIEQCKG